MLKFVTKEVIEKNTIAKNIIKALLHACEHISIRVSLCFRLGEVCKIEERVVRMVQLHKGLIGIFEESAAPSICLSANASCGMQINHDAFWPSQKEWKKPTRCLQFLESVCDGARTLPRGRKAIIHA